MFSGVDSHEQTLISTQSLVSSHLSSSSSGRFYQPACGNKEGWGPLSPHRYDFTPCFLDVWIASVAAFGIVLGAGAIWYLHRKCPPQPVKQNWHFWAKLVSETKTF